MRLTTYPTATGKTLVLLKQSISALSEPTQSVSRKHLKVCPLGFGGLSVILRIYLYTYPTCPHLVLSKKILREDLVESCNKSIIRLSDICVSK
jgi:hypothetical protein